MNPEEKLEMGRKMIAEAEAEIAAKKRNWPERVEAGMLFRKDCGALYIAHTCERGEVDNLVCVSGGGAGANWVFRKFFDGDEAKFTYLGHARDLIKIADAAHEPTGAELVGKMCEFSADGKNWRNEEECIKFDDSCTTLPYLSATAGWFTYARIARFAR